MSVREKRADIVGAEGERRSRIRFSIDSSQPDSTFKIFRPLSPLTLKFFYIQSKLAGD